MDRLRKLLAEGKDFLVAAKEAGYAQTTIQRKRAELQGQAAMPGVMQKELRRGFVHVQEWSPVSGKTFTRPAPAAEVKTAESKPAVQPFIPQTFEHPVFGEGRQSANGGFLPDWCADSRSGGDYNTGDLPTPGTRPVSCWAKLREDQDRLARSYRGGARETPPLPEWPDEPEEIPQRGFKDQGRDVATEALEGRFGFAEVPMRGE